MVVPASFTPSEDSVSNRTGSNKGDVKAQNARWYAKNRERHKKNAAANAKDRRLQAAGRPRPTGCEICGARTESKLQFDHDHACCRKGCAACFRGWLCGDCNSALGFAKDSTDRLISMVAYLLRTEQL